MLLVKGLRLDDASPLSSRPSTVRRLIRRRPYRLPGSQPKHSWASWLATPPLPVAPTLCR